MSAKRFISCAVCAGIVAAAGAVAFAEDDAPKGYVSFTAIKSVIGQGFTVQPEVVPFYEGENGLDVVLRAAEIKYEESDYGAFITGFADEDSAAEIPAVITEVCPNMTGRNAEGMLSSYDYTPESGWSYFLNGEYAQVGISDYTPADGDVLEFRYTVYGYGADLGIDNSSWGGAAAIVEATDSHELIRACAKAAGTEAADTPQYEEALSVLGKFGASQQEIDEACKALDEAATAPDTTADSTVDASNTSDTSDAGDAVDKVDTDNTGAAADKGSPDTGVEGIAAIFGAAVLAVICAAASKKR